MALGARRHMTHEWYRARYGRACANGAFAVTIAALTFVMTACSPPPRSNKVARGRFIYATNCTACHNLDPNLPGPVGPPIAGSSEILVKDRVLHLAYPPSYHPKRTTHLMRAFPELAPDVSALAAFLQAARDKPDGASPAIADPPRPDGAQ